MYSKPLLQKGLGSIESHVFSYDIQTLVANMKKNHSWKKGELNAMVLLKNPEKHIVLTLLRRGTEILSHQSNDSVSFHVIEGKLKFHSENEKVTIDQGMMLTLHENIKYKLKSNADTAFLLTTSNSLTDTDSVKHKSANSYLIDLLARSNMN